MRVDLGKMLLACVLFCVGGLAHAAGYYDDDYYNGDYDNSYNSNYSNNGYGYGGNHARAVTCESRNQRTVYCRIDARNGVRISRQLSSGACVEGRTWGWNSRGVWVSGGCRAEFVVASGYGNGNGYGNGDYYGNNGYGSGYGRVVRCESVNSRTTYCAAGGPDVRLIRRLSQAACIEGRTWGRDRRGIWVSNGCRAEFRVEGNGSYYGGGYGNGYDYGNGNGYGYNQRVLCESRDGRYNFCRTGSYIRSAQVSRQLSSSSCQYNYNWGYRSDGIWVNNGCRAEFVVY